MPTAAAPRALTTPKQVVEQFLAALEDKDVDRASALLAPDVVYTNVSLPSIRGAATVQRLFEQSTKVSRVGFHVTMHRIVAEGDLVLTERTDTISVGPVHARFWVCGTFEVTDGLITLWRDYFDWINVTSGMVRGVLGAALPALRAPLPEAPPR